MPWARSLRAEYPQSDYAPILAPYEDAEDIAGIMAFFDMIDHYPDLCFNPGNDQAFRWEVYDMGLEYLEVALVWEVRYGHR